MSAISRNSMIDGSSSTTRTVGVAMGFTHFTLRSRLRNEVTLCALLGCSTGSALSRRFCSPDRDIFGRAAQFLRAYLYLCGSTRRGALPSHHGEATIPVGE